MFICMILASALFVIFAILFLTAGDSLAKALIVCNVEIQTETIKKTQIEMNLLAEQMKKSGQQDKKKLKQGKVLKKKQDEARKQLEILKKGKISVLDIIPLAGYRMIQILDWDGTSDVVKKLNQKLASVSGTGTLYEEMNRVLLDFDNNVSPVEAYSRFITKCNNLYTTKLATAIIQNTSKGNSEIVSLFRQLNDESWLEHKHDARRMGEKIQSKLLLPTMLMFAGIIILIIVPVMSGFNF